MNVFRRIFGIFRIIGVIATLSFFSLNAWSETPTCNENQMLYNDTCIDAPFSLTTTDDTDSFSFAMSAAGTFYVDWGDGTDVQQIVRNNMNTATYSHTYDSAGSYTIKFGGNATGYNTSANISAISFGIYSSNSNTPSKIGSISGSLGRIFKTVENPTVGQSQPGFYYTFGGAENMNCEIPESLFDGIYGNPTWSMFQGTFYNCKKLKGSIPDSLFAGITGTNGSMFLNTFTGCIGLTGSIPENLFANISGNPMYAMFADTFSGCTGLTGSIPENLFSGISGSPAQDMFYHTFYNNSGLNSFIDKDGTVTNYIPSDFLSNIDTTNGYTSGPMKYMFSGTGLATQCPENTYKYNTPFAIDWNPKVSCEPCPDAYPNSETGANSIESCYADITYTYNYDTPTIHARAYYDSEKPDGYSIDLPEPTRENYVFDGWTFENLDSVDDETVFNGNTTLYATWKMAPKFTVTIRPNNENDPFSFKLSAAGTFYVDWGDDSPVETITKDNLDEQTYSHQYASPYKEYTIGFSGAATGYNTDEYTSTITFNISGSYYDGSNAPHIRSISGSLGAIFGTLENPSIGESQPRFYKTFSNCTSIKTLPENLFQGISGATTHMFSDTFHNCLSLKNIPENLFQGISGAAGSMFKGTFRDCSGLQSIPDGLFYGISGAASGMFDGTFRYCSGLKSIPEHLFNGISGAADSMFNGTFSGCSGLESVPDGLFNGISGAEANMFSETFSRCTGLKSIPEHLFNGISGAASGLFYQTFYGCSNITTIPSGLFNGISGAGMSMFVETFKNCTGLTAIPEDLFNGVSDIAGTMFYRTFYGCSNLTNFVDKNNNNINYIPYDFLSNIDTTTNGYIPGSMSGMFSGTGLATQCPENMYKSDSPFQNDWNPKVSCIPCPDDYPYSAQGSTSKNSCYTTGTTNCSAYNPYTSGAGTATYANESVYFKEYSDGQLEYGSDALNICAITDLDCPVEYTKTTEPTLACVPNVYTITYHINGGEIPAGAIIPETYTIESDDITLPAATREHYVFDGWCDDAEMTTNCEIIKTIPNGSTNNREFFAKWEKESIVCVAGEYLPAGANVCKKCPRNGYCEGGNFTYSEDIDNGITLCPPDEYGTPEYNSALNACVSMHTYGLGPGYLTGETLPNSELAANNNNIISYQTCRYNPTTDAYTDCFDLSIGIFQIACKNGYTVLNQQDISGWKSVWNATNNGNAIEIIKNGHVGEPYACVAAEPGYYTGVYDIVQKYISDVRSTTTDELDEEFLSYMDSMSEKIGFGFAEGEIRALEDTNVSFDEIYKKCPDAYPNSLAASWKQAHCYSNIKFNTNNGTVMPDMILHYDSTRPNGYSIDDLPVPANDNNDVVFDGWYENSDFSGQKITSDTLLVGDKVLYAKWKFVCRSGIWLHFGYNEKDKACLSSTQPDKPRMVFNIDGDKYYLNISDDTQKQISEESDLKMYIFYGGQKRTIHDQSVE